MRWAAKLNLKHVHRHYIWPKRPTLIATTPTVNDPTTHNRMNQFIRMAEWLNCPMQKKYNSILLAFIFKIWWLCWLINDSLWLFLKIQTENKNNNFEQFRKKNWIKLTHCHPLVHCAPLCCSIMHNTSSQTQFKTDSALMNAKRQLMKQLNKLYYG